MERLLSGHRARVVLAVLIVGALIFGGGSSAIAQEDAATDQRVVRLLGTYEIQPDLGQVNVVEEITVSNVKGSQRSGDTVTTFFWTGHEIWLPSDAENVAIEVEGEPLEWEVFDTVSGVDIIAANYRRNLNFGQTRVIDVTYTLPTYGPGLGDRRINAAFFELEVLICCNFEEIDLTVTAPASFDVTPPLNLQFESAVAGSNQVFTYTDNEVTGEFTEVIFTDWVGIDDAGLEGTSATVGSDALLISYPPDDEEWSTDVSGFVEEAGATLEGLLGSPWPIDNFTLRQGPNRSFGPWGVTGPFDQPVTLPRDYGRQGLAATMVQAWLSDGPFDDEVIRNGLAYDLATEVVSLSGGREVTPLPPSGAGALDAEDSLWVMRQVSDEIGHDGLGMIVQMANNSETAYVGTGPAETVATIPGDWRRFIDLAEQRLDSRNVVGVFEEYVLQGEQLTQLEERSSTLATYESLEADADGVVPLGIRTAMTNWDFAQANTLLSAAQEVVTERDRVIGDDPERAADAGLAFGETWANAESVEDLEAVRTSVLDRESELNGGLLQILLYGLIGLIVLGGLAAAAFFFSRRKKSKSTPSGPSTPSNPTGGPVAEAASATVAAWPAPQEGWPAPGQQPQPQPGQQTVSAPAPQPGVSPPAGTPPPGSATMPGTPPAGPPPGGPPPGGPPPYAPPPTS